LKVENVFIVWLVVVLVVWLFNVANRKYLKVES